VKQIASCAPLVVCLSLTCAAAGAENPLVLPVWPDKVPGDYGSIGEERIRPPSDAPTKDAKWLTNVTKPTLTVYRPAKEKNTGAAMLICPGGGYWNLAWDLEGEEVAAWLNTVGMTGIVLNYRVPRRPGQPEALPAPGPLLDAQRALSLVRSRATEWGIDPNRIGMVGFSAGGHLALATATNFDKRAYEPIDAIDKVSCRPDFAVSVYPGYLVAKAGEPRLGRAADSGGGRAPGGHLASYMRIPAGTPPVFLVHASDDTMANAENSVVMYLALERAGILTELHVYAKGGHGFGVRKSDQPCCTWTERCVAWLRNQGVLKAGTSQ
jgi:acetyl esterase/lipase